nr:hypothetical protein [Tanacetum cinerariifolium]
MADPSGRMLTICFPRIREALCKIEPGLTLRSLIASSLSQRKPTRLTAQAWTGIPMRNMSMTSSAAWATKSRKAAPLLHSSQGISSSGTPNMKIMS